MKKTLLKTITVIVLAFMVFSFTGCAELLGLESTESLPKFKDFEELLAYMQNSSAGYMYGLRDGAPGVAMPEESAAADNSKDAGQSGTSYGETNLQVEGVDEADVIKNDGRDIYFIAGNTLVIVDSL
nr:beta-propeller domain-containing protein [Clostridia bacterium]